MAASWCHLRLWYRTTGEKLYKTSSSSRFLALRGLLSSIHVSKQRFCLTSEWQKDNFQKVTYDVPTLKGQKKDTSCLLPTAYSPQYVEAAWYDWWVSQGYFEVPSSQSSGSDKKDQFVMLLPPPNVTGTLHLGHALTNSIQDALIRWHRMKGNAALWVPGTDHAGIATQVVVEKTLWSQKRLTRHQLGRSDFEAEVWKWKEQKGNVIEEQMKSLGSSFDWSYNFFTLDERLSEAVGEGFVRLYDRGKVYRDTQLVNWSCSLQSSISDIEVDNITVEGRTRRQVPGYREGVEFGVLSSFAYPVEDSEEEIVVSTTRLETMLGDTAVAVHPEDARYAHLVGRRVQHPLCGRTVPVIADAFVDRAFGSGAVKITPGHDPTDHEVGRKHRLPELSILDDEGKLCGEVPGQFEGMPRFLARKAVQAALTDLGLYRGEINHSMVLPVCSRSGDVVEARLKEQWFLNCQQMAERAVQAVKQGELTFSAPHHEALWYEWLSKGRDWCLSRQLWWGHRIPAYRFQTEEGEVWIAAKTEAEAINKFSHLHPSRTFLTVTQDEDVLDTWFSSALLPFSVFGWPEDTESLRQLYPLSLMETGHDILFFWVARMVMLGLELTDTLPFKQVLLHGIIRDANGRKMSKSLGNVIDPMDVIRGASLQALHATLDSGRLSKQEMKVAQDGQRKNFPQGIPECGADALRFTLCSYDFKAESIPMDVLHTRTHRLFCNKIWQAFRFMQPHLQHGDFSPLGTYEMSGHEEAVDLWILSRLSDMVAECDRGFDSHNLHQATKALHRFWLTEFCDVYLECCKPVFQSDDRQKQDAVRQILFLLTHTFLRALSPFMPFLTEELYQRLPVKGEHWSESVCVAPYPLPCEFPWQSDTIDQEMGQVLQICQHVLSIRHEYNITKPVLPVYISLKAEEQLRSEELKYTSVLNKLCRADPVTIMREETHTVPSGCATSVLTSHCQVHVQLKDHVDFARELERLLQKRSKVLEQQEHVTTRLSDLLHKGKGHIPAAQKLQVKEQSLMAQLKVISDSIDSVTSMKDC